MGYILGVDLGTTFSAAAVARDGRAEIVSLGSRGAAVPSVVLLRADGEVLVGEAAERRATSEPERTAREFKRRLGDPTPLLLGGTPYGAEALTAHLLRAVVGQVTELEGAPPERIVLCHPANYGAFKLDLLSQAVRIAGCGDVTFLAEPQAAAVHYAAQERLEPGDCVAVYDFGGGTFDAAVLRKSEAGGFDLLGIPEGLDRLGGIDFDQAVFGHVERALAGAIEEIDADDAAALAALARLRDDCRAAKEALSLDTDAQIPVLLPALQTEVRITRPEFEAMVRTRVDETIDALERAIHSAGLEPDDIARVLLVGGSSRIPLVAELVRQATRRPVALDAHPKHAIALGAAMAGAAGPSTAQVGETPAAASGAVAAAPGVSDALAPASAPERLVAAQRPRSRMGRRVIIAVALAALTGGGAAMALRGGGDARTAVTTETSAATSTSAAPATVASPTTVALAGPLSGGMIVTVDKIRLAGETYVVEFTTANFTPEEGGHHIHFYFGTSDVGNLISGGATSEYVDYAGSSPFRGLTTSDRPSDVLFLCASVADASHTPASLSGNCVALPG